MKETDTAGRGCPALNYDILNQTKWKGGAISIHILTIFTQQNAISLFMLYLLRHLKSFKCDTPGGAGACL